MAQTTTVQEVPEPLRILPRSPQQREIESLKRDFGITSREAWTLYEHFDRDFAVVRAYLQNR